MIDALAVIPAPDPLPLPAPPGLMWFLLMLTFFIHLLGMNFVLGGSLIALAARARGNDDATKLARRFGKAMPVVVAATVTFGVAPLLFLQVLYGRLFFSSSVLMAWVWLAVVPLLILAYYGTYAIAIRGEKTGGRGTLAIAGGVAAIFVTIAFIYSNNMSLMLRPERFLGMYIDSARGAQLNRADPTLVARYLHMLLGAVAVAGLFVALYGYVASRREEAHGRWAMRHGAMWFAGATMLNVIAGTWWGMALPREVVLRFMGGSLAATTWLIIGSVTGIAALGLMAGAIRADDPRPLVFHSAWMTLVTLVSMIVSRDHVRAGMLELANFQPVTWIEPQWSIIAIFAVLLVAALGVVAWMGMMLMRSRTA
jgi:hypothetical protein